MAPVPYINFNLFGGNYVSNEKNSFYTSDVELLGL